MRFRYIGQEGFSGYVKGRVYRLRIYYHTGGEIPNGLTITVVGFRNLFRRKHSVYTNKDIFYKNWQRVS